MGSLIAQRHRMVTLTLALGMILVNCGPSPGSGEPPGPITDRADAGAVGVGDTGIDDDAAPDDVAPDDAVPVTPAEEGPGIEDEALPAADREPADVIAQEARMTVESRVARPRVVTEVAWTPFAVIGDLVLAHPSSAVEVVAFHEASHDGAQQMDVAVTAVAPMVLDTRGRDTGSRTAADIVVAPEVEVRSPVTGTVLRAGRYVLYCDNSDGYAVIEPDGYPGWEVKVLHIDGVLVERGDRVEAGYSVLAVGPTPLPFRSQVDRETADPSWPHVHVEVVDTAVPNRTRPGGGC